MTRTRHLLAALATCVALGGCAERQTNIDDEPLLEPACMILPARGYWNDGSTWTITNEDESTGSVCMCMTRRELEDKVYVDELNERGLAECNRMSTLHHDFDWTNCQDSYEQGVWLDLVHIAAGEQIWANHLGLTCDGDDPAGGCSLTTRDAPNAGWTLLVIAGLLRRRATAAAASGSPPVSPPSSTLPS